MLGNYHKSTVVYSFCLIVLVMVLGLGSAPIALAQSKNSTLPTIKHRKTKKKVKVPKTRRQPQQVKDKTGRNRTTKRKARARDTYQRPASKSARKPVFDRYQRPASKSGRKPIFDRYQQPKTKTSSGKVFDTYQRPASKAASGVVRDRYQRPKTKTRSGVVHDRYQRPKTASKRQKVRDNYQRPPTISSSGMVKDRYQIPKSATRSGEGNIKDRYERPKTISASGKVKVTKGREAPPLEEGQNSPWLPLGNRIFSNQRLLKKKEKALQKASAQTAGYQGSQKRGIFYSKERQYKQADRRQMDVGEYRAPHKFQQKKIEENYSKYVHQHRGFWRGMTAKAKSRYFEKLSRKVHQYNGDIKRPRRGKDMHPSVDYLTARQKNTHKKKEKYRRRRIWLSHIFKSKDQPKHLKENTRKPRYDKKEAEIWNY